MWVSAKMRLISWYLNHCYLCEVWKKKHNVVNAGLMAYLNSIESTLLPFADKFSWQALSSSFDSCALRHKTNLLL